MANVAKYNTMTCQPGAICTGTSEEDFSWRSTGYGSTYRERLRRPIPCPDCWVEVESRSMVDRSIILNVTEPDIKWGLIPVIHM